MKNCRSRRVSLYALVSVPLILLLSAQLQAETTEAEVAPSETVTSKTTSSETMASKTTAPETTASEQVTAEPLSVVKTVATDVVDKMNSANTPEATKPELPDEPVALSVEELKKKVIKLNRDLFILEEDLLFPANTQFSVYVSLDTGEFFTPDALTLKLNDEVIASHLYTERQLKALKKGGMQRLHLGNLKTGEHEMTAIAVGKGTDGRDIKKAASLRFTKEADIAAFEVRIQDHSSQYQALVDIVQWDN